MLDGDLFASGSIDDWGTDRVERAESVDTHIDSNNPMGYGMVSREGNTNSDGVGIGGGVGRGPEGYEGHVTFYVEAPDVEAALAKAEELGGSRMMGPDEPWRDS